MRPRHLAPLALLAFASPLLAATRSLPLTAYGQASSPDGNTFSVTPAADPLFTDYTNSLERRAILEFNLNPLPVGAAIQTVTLTFAVSSTQALGSPAVYPDLNFYGYAGNNAINTADATEDANLDSLAVVTIDAARLWFIPLDVVHVQSYVTAHAAALGVLTYAQRDNQTVAIRTTATALPSLSITYTIAGDANGDDRITRDDYALLDRGFAMHLAGFSNGDFNNDGNIGAADYLILDNAFRANGGSLSPEDLANRESLFGPDYLTALSTPLPEPAILVPLAACLPVLRRRRPNCLVID